MEFTVLNKYDISFNEDDYNAVVRVSTMMESLLDFMKEHHCDVLTTSCGDSYGVPYLNSIHSYINELWDIMENGSILTKED